MNCLHRPWLLLAALALFFSAARNLPAAECELCGVSLDIPGDGLWQDVRKDGWLSFAMMRGDELFATIEVSRIYNEARYSLDQFAEHYQEYTPPTVVIEGGFASLTLNGIPVRWGRGRGQAEDGGKFLVHLVFFMVDRRHTCQLLTAVRKDSKNLHEFLLPQIIQSLNWLKQAKEQ